MAPGAQAHDALVSSIPSANATLTTAPENITLTFSESVLPMGSQIAVKAPGQQSAQALGTQVNGKIVTAPFKPTRSGNYEMVWRVTSADGHPVSGTVKFTLKGANSTTSASPNALGSASAAVVPASPSQVSGPSTPTTNEPGDNYPWLVIGVSALGLAAVVGGLVVAKRRVRDDA